MADSKDTLLNRKDYLALKKDIADMLQSGASRASTRRIEAYWEIGQRITSERLATKAGYHNGIIRELAKDIGTSARTLQRAVTLHEYYRKPPASKGLTWAHVRLLLQVPDKKRRTLLTRQAIKESLTPRELAALLGGEEEEQTDSALKRPSSSDYLYKAEVHSVIDGDTLELDIDLGFSVFRRQRIRLASLNCAELKTTKGRAAKDFVTQKVFELPHLVVKTNKVDIYGRYVAHVFLSKRGTTIENGFKRGLYLNNLLVEEKLARKAR